MHIFALREYDYPSDETCVAIVPVKAAKTIASMLASCADEIGVAISGRNISLWSEGCQLIYRLIDGKYPNYRSVIPQNDLSVEVDTQQLLGALKRTSIFADQTNNTVVMELAENRMIVSSRDDYRRVSSREEIGIDYHPVEPFKINFIASNIISLIQSLSCERCTLRFSAPERAALIAAEEEKTTLLIMPLYVSNP
jgi:DNA polymerase-3 subunit beta